MVAEWERLKNDKFATISEHKELYRSLQKEECDPQLLKNVSRKIKELRAIYRQKEVRFVDVKGGSIGLCPKPSVDKLKKLQSEKIGMIVSLIKEDEGVAAIKDYAAANELNWTWFPLSASDLQEGEREEELLLIYEQLMAKLLLGERILIHCAAGVHRTGLFTYGLLLKCGYDRAAAKELIYRMRPVTAIERVERHWRWSAGVVDGGSSNVLD